MAVTNSLNINDDGLQDFDSTTGQFDATALTTKGDLLGYTGSAYQRFPIGTDGYVLKADSSQAVGWRWACPAFEFIDSQTASSSTTIEFTGFADSSCYCAYKIVWIGASTTGGTRDLNMRFSIDNGSSWLSSNYSYARESARDDGTLVNRYSSSDSVLNLASHSGDSSLIWRNGEAFLYNSSDPSTYLSQGITFTETGVSGNAQFFTARGVGLHPTTSEINGIQFLQNTGTITNGTFYLYGMLR